METTMAMARKAATTPATTVAPVGVAEPRDP